MAIRRLWAWHLMTGIAAGAVVIITACGNDTPEEATPTADAGPPDAPADGASADAGYSSCIPEETCDGKSCCSSIEVPAGQTVIAYEADAGVVEKTVGVSTFRLDEFEVTVGRMKRFLAQGYGTTAHPPEAGSGSVGGLMGWNPIWSTSYLPTTADDVEFNLRKCPQSTWDNANATVPATCVDWFLAFAFCVADGGRLPTEAEWTYAARGSDGRVYPWSAPAATEDLDSTRAVYCADGHPTADGGSALTTWACDSTPGVQAVASKGQAGKGPFGHSDLAGNALEWTLDGFASSSAGSCTQNCVEASGLPYHVLKGGSWLSPSPLLKNAARASFTASLQLDYLSLPASQVGFRCARDLP